MVKKQLPLPSHDSTTKTHFACTAAHTHTHYNPFAAFVSVALKMKKKEEEEEHKKKNNRTNGVKRWQRQENSNIWKWTTSHPESGTQYWNMCAALFAISRSLFLFRGVLCMFVCLSRHDARCKWVLLLSGCTENVHPIRNLSLSAWFGSARLV